MRTSVACNSLLQWKENTLSVVITMFNVFCIIVFRNFCYVV